uniref:uncharacterized protein LOC118546101 n=1 Tax=Halichoerus grypus TaxID=9711 RepID=UPI0016596CD9|nr:uncharacterized protein LOC118546101 [Halichoerus grypus]
MGTDQRALLQPETSGHSPPTWQTERKLCALAGRVVRTPRPRSEREARTVPETGRPKLDAASECGAEARWTVSWTSTRGSRQSETRRPAPSALSPHGLRGFEKGDAPALGRATLLVQERHLLWGEPRSLSRRRTCCGESHAPCPGDAPAVGRATVFVKLMHLLWGEPRSLSRRRTCCGESHAPCPGDAPAVGRATVFVKLMHLLWGEPRSFSRRRTCCGESHAPCPGDAPAGGRAVAHCSSLEAQQESWAR